MKDLIVLVADKNMQFAVSGLLDRHDALQVRPLDCDVYPHPEKDPGCLRRSHDFLRPYIGAYAHALVMFDRDGCGKQQLSRKDLEREVEAHLRQNGWDNRGAAVVFDPELEAWVWSNSPQVDAALGWEGKQPDLRTWVIQQGFAHSPQAKPVRPKEAVEQALRTARKPRSSSLYRQLAGSVGLESCIDPAFTKFRATLRRWFAN